MKHKRKYKWVFFYLIKSVDEYWPVADKMILSLLNIKLHKEIAIVICLKANGANLSVLYPRKPQYIGRENTTLFYEVKENFPITPNGLLNHLSLIDEEPEFDIRDPEHIIRFFKIDVLNPRKADNYVLFTWDHGSPFGMFKEGKDIVVGENTTRLTMDNLAKAIHIGFDGKKIDIIVMTNCYLQFFDTGYSLSSATKFLIASETFMYFDSYDFPAIFKKVYSNTGISPKRLSRFIVDSFKKKNKEIQKGVALFCNQLKYYKVLSILIHQLAKKLMENMDEYRPALTEIREEMIEVQTTYSLVDFYRFIFLLSQKISDRNMTLIEQIEESKKKVITRFYIGEDHKGRYPKILQHPSGFSIFFPKNDSFINDIVKDYFFNDSPNATLFTRVAKWNDMIFLWLKMGPLLQCDNKLTSSLP